MKIIQIVSTLAFGAAVGNNVLTLDKAIKDMGYDTIIYAENIDKRISEKIAKPIHKLRKLTNTDIIIYHKSIGTDLSFRLDQYPGRKIMIYHNITPPKFFYAYNSSSVAATRYGLEGVRYLKDKIDYCLVPSNYNKKDLIEMEFNCPIDVLPILIPFDDYQQMPNSKIIEQYTDDGYINIIFVGRVAPHKKQENVIRTFYQYKKLNPKSRLILVGSYFGMENYYERLVTYINKLGLEDVVFTGHIKFDEILAYYHIADVFLCMSEHEGFCVPLVEAMYFDVPIIAYNTSAIGDTLGGSGILIDDNNPLFIAMLIQKVVENESLRVQVLNGQRKRLEDFQYDKVRGMLQKYLDRFISER